VLLKQLPAVLDTVTGKLRKEADPTPANRSSPRTTASEINATSRQYGLARIYIFIAYYI
jgi:hypothetical protein